MEIVIKNAVQAQAPAIARLIMTAMTSECCLHFCGAGHGLDDFYRMMTRLVEHEHSQYSYCNTLVAMDGDRVVGVAVSYDGGELHELRRAFLAAALEYLGADHSGMDDETAPGELYLDSLAVEPQYRRRGIARRLIVATKGKATDMGLPLGLLVDSENDGGAAFYNAVGFRYAGVNHWGGHPMRHLLL